MIWLTWRQFRAQGVIAVVALAAFAALLAATGPQLASLYAASGAGTCHGNGCSGFANNFLTQLDAGGAYPALDLLSIAMVLVVPAVIGVFWGAPLIAREFEAGTHHLAWNQTVTRTRWLAVKLGLTGLAAMAVTEGLSLMQAWWAAPIGDAVSRGGSGTLIALNQFSPPVFAAHGITPLAYAAFGFALGVAAGVLLRRAVPAMAVTLVVFGALQVAMPLWIRPNLIPPDHAVIDLAAAKDVRFQTSVAPSRLDTFSFSAGGLSADPEAWLLSSGAVDAAGKPTSTIPAACTDAVNGGSGLDCLSSNGIRVAVTYQPASRYWTLEWTETALYLALALALAAFAFWRLRRRVS